MTTGVIEPANLAHAPALALIHAEAFPPGEQWSAEAWAAQLALPGTFGFISGRGGALLLRVAADESEVLTVAVLPEARGQGLGRALLDRAKTEARARGAESMVLEVSVANAPALRLYAAADFQTVGRRPRYYPGGSDALIQRCTLA